MYRLINTIIICCLFFVIGSQEARAAWPWQAKGFVELNGIIYAPDDYKHWWANWREPGMDVPENLDKFIEWKLLADEATSMELFNEESYKHKIDVYLKARTRMLLKFDEVDSKITLSDEEIQNRFNRDYSPVMYVTTIYYATADEATKAYESLKNKVITFEELQQKPATEGGPRRTRRNIVIPKQIKTNKDFTALKNLSAGNFSEPQTSKHYSFILHLDEKKIPSQDDFLKRKKNIKNIISKEKEAKLTVELVNRLWKKYEVQINEDLLEMAKKDLSGEVLKEPLVTTNRENIPMYLLVKDLRKEYEIRKLNRISEKAEQDLKNGLLNGMITEYLISWESADRKYEEKPPFQWSYEFYKENRLIKELERMLIASQVNVSEASITEYYNENLNNYMTIGLVSYSLVKDEKDVVEKVWREVDLGQDFSIAAKKFKAEVVPVRDVPLNNISSQLLREILENLNTGGISDPFELDGKFAVVKVVERQEPEPIPLKELRGKIITKLKNEEFKRLRSEYLAKLLAQSDISINHTAWKKLRKELQGEPR
jgi:hypothetical protein